jgi:hypothetical protein
VNRVLLDLKGCAFCRMPANSLAVALVWQC